ncbi:tetratricopeptide repeat protein [Pelagibius sp. CAU 1746]|uniref:tetratricopeptide repeat protein n=1 Tax=Pelagibius sp. CAU 1746 TaxID=3140370 RepID=UPI00325BE159
MTAPTPRSSPQSRPGAPGTGLPEHVKAAAVLRNRAVAALKQGRGAEAEALLQEAVRVFPGFAEAEIRIGNIRRARGDLEGAVQAYRRALKIKPDYAWAHLELAICLQRGGDTESALDHYRQAVRHNPKLYKTVLFAMVDQPQGSFWLDIEALKRELRIDAPAQGPGKDTA